MKKITGKKLAERLIARTQLSYGLTREQAITKLILLQHDAIVLLGKSARFLCDSLLKELDGDFFSSVKEIMKGAETKKAKSNRKKA
jgi:hypothetical protein